MKLNSPFSDSGDFNISVWDDLTNGTWKRKWKKCSYRLLRSCQHGQKSNEVSQPTIVITVGAA